MEAKESTQRFISYETMTRSFVKSLVYRLLSLSGTVILSWQITKDVSETISITLAVQLFLIVLYFASERFWNRIHWGKKFDILKGDAEVANARKVRIEYYI